MPLNANETMLTLSFGGVDFSFEPIQTNAVDADSNDMLSVSKIRHGEVFLNLKNFSGTLRVTSQNPQPELPTLNDDKDDNRWSNKSSQNDAIDGDDAVVPNPVEDTPSPQHAKSCPDSKASEPTKQRKGQQKLNFVGIRDQESQQYEAKKKVTSTKRCMVDDQLEVGSTKKSCTGAKSAEDVAQDIRDFNDFIEERDDEVFGNEPIPPSLGQTIPSQDDDFSKGSDYSLHNNVATGTASNLQFFSISNNKSALGTVAPCCRWGQTMTLIDHRRLIVYGGQTIEKGAAKPLADLFVYDMTDGAWTQPIHCDGVARTWHSANFLPERQLLLCFGGEILDKVTGKLVTTDQVMVLDTDIMLWYPPVVSGQIPSGRSGHSSCVLPQTNELVVFGGVKNGKWLNSVAVLDTNRWRWSTMKAVGNAPRPRSYHSATVVSSGASSELGNRVVIIGGNDGSECFNSVHLLEVSGEGKKGIWSNPMCKGDVPTPRTGHSATLLNDGTTIMVYGGWDPNHSEEENDHDLIFGDSFLLDTKTWTWRSGPKPRYVKSKNSSNGGAHRVGHSAVLAPGGQMVFKYLHSVGEYTKTNSPVISKALLYRYEFITRSS